MLVAIEKVCKVLGPLAGECKTLIEEYFDQMWKLVIDKVVSCVCVCERESRNPYSNMHL